ncbi:MAG: NDP-sugar synthase [Halobacteria archaeon]
MKAVVLAGGYATRLWPITKNRAKPLLPVGGTPIIDHIIRPLEELDVIEEVYVSTNKRFEEDFEEYIEANGFVKTIPAIEETTAEDEKFGTIGALEQLIRRESIDEDLLVVAGDNLFSFGIPDFLESYQEREEPTIAAYDVESREKAKQYGLVNVDGGEVVDFQEKPDNPDSTLVSIACYVFPADTLDLITEYLEGDNNPDAPGFFIEWLQNRNSVHSYVFDGVWYDIGTPDSYLDANREMMDSETYVHEDAVVEGSELGDGSYVMEDAVVEDSEIGNSIIFPEAEVEEAEVDDTVIDTCARVNGIDIEESIVGEYSRVQD